MVTIAEKISSRIHTETQLVNKNIGFTTAYLGIQHLESIILNTPDIITKETCLVLLHLIQSRQHETKKQAYFLYKTAALSLISISKNQTHPLTGFLIVKLQEILLSSTGNKQRAVSEALGSLPLRIKGPTLKESQHPEILNLSFAHFLDHINIKKTDNLKWVGRTLVFTTPDKMKCCIKFTKFKADETQLASETMWLLHLNQQASDYHHSFEIPKPIIIDNHCLFKFTDVPDDLSLKTEISNRFIAIAFVTHPTYFDYPNLPKRIGNDPQTIVNIFGRNAKLLGQFASKGIIHTAMIPLFHNRAQQSRRDDQGVYNWEQGGRLDQWLKSSQYPNFAVSGLRDFEHLISITDSKQIRHFIGEHVLSLILVAGSYFRNKTPEKFGYDENHQPMDLRHLFDLSLFERIIKKIIQQYYLGMSGVHLKQIDRLLKPGLIKGLIQVMGIDVHMEETLRVQDQENMEDAQFINYLKQRGQTTTQIQHMAKAKQDITILTGPHLGGFNQAISIPILVNFLFCLSSVYVSDCYLMENGLKAYLN